MTASPMSTSRVNTPSPLLPSTVPYRLTTPLAVARLAPSPSPPHHHHQHHPLPLLLRNRLTRSRSLNPVFCGSQDANPLNLHRCTTLPLHPVAPHSLQ